MRYQLMAKLLSSSIFYFQRSFALSTPGLVRHTLDLCSSSTSISISYSSQQRVMDKGKRPMTAAHARAEAKAKKTTYRSSAATLHTISQSQGPDHDPDCHGPPPTSSKPLFPVESNSLGSIVGAQMDLGKAKLNADDIVVEHHATKCDSRMARRDSLRLHPSSETVVVRENETSDRKIQQWLDARYIASPENVWYVFRDWTARYGRLSETNWTALTPMTTSFAPQPTIGPHDGVKHFPKPFFSGTSTNTTDEYPFYRRRPTVSNPTQELAPRAEKTTKYIFKYIDRH